MRTVLHTRARAFAALISTLTLAGCLDVEEDVRLHPDGRVSYRCVLSEPVRMQTLGPDLALGVRRRLEGTPAVLRLESTTATRGETRITTIDAELQPSSSDELPTVEGFRVEPLGAGRYRITRQLSSREAATPERPDPLGELLGRQLLGRHGYTLRLHAPRVLSANGAIDPSGTSVEWAVSWNDLKGAVLTAEVELDQPTDYGWVGLAVALGFGLLGWGLFVRERV